MYESKHEGSDFRSDLDYSSYGSFKTIIALFPQKRVTIDRYSKKKSGKNSTVVTEPLEIFSTQAILWHTLHGESDNTSDWAERSNPVLFIILFCDSSTVQIYTRLTDSMNHVGVMAMHGTAWLESNI